MSILVGLLLFFVGGFIGVATMCLVQVAGEADRRTINYEDRTEKSEPRESL
ncbi:DUF3789 domain-containing protein [Enterococcus gilvus]|uniref:DUF3789 domain-containing protein n=1 Tax=Enterococcus gilvus ATCC BAA-350 TaxID=1158614 RepID=R2VCJ9_9ENTE|nr:DUF3789 domain-containing protein [Enterococcus gilvus]EOI55410.1 hypothetical protein UKC_02618 [Enterococcus gilvus ATCC BAA-350]EOW82047.1 hypothetical protein I592_01348 [Enterococcus gilvus ATCC BAA-350]OJG43076.1 hypothetical protein RV02_GL002996 [Enterococcus gilvus]